jgi:PAS domain S-box
MKCERAKKIRGNGSTFEEKFSEQLLKMKGRYNLFRILIVVNVVSVLIAILWIYLTNEVLRLYIENKEEPIKIGILKGWIYVLIISIIVGGLSYLAMKKLEALEREIYMGFEELSGVYLKLDESHKKLMSSEESLRRQYDLLLESQQKLKDNEEWYRLISEGTNDGIWDEKNGERYFSDRWFEITGYSKEELKFLGNWEKLIHPEDKEGFLNNIKDLRDRKGDFYRNEYRLRTKDGKYRWILAKAKICYNEDGSIKRMAGSHTDITELKEYEEALIRRAYYDVLTGLPNRMSLNEDLYREIIVKKNARGAMFLLIWIILNTLTIQWDMALASSF